MWTTWGVGLGTRHARGATTDQYLWQQEHSLSIELSSRTPSGSGIETDQGGESAEDLHRHFEASTLDEMRLVDGEFEMNGCAADGAAPHREGEEYQDTRRLRERLCRQNNQRPCRPGVSLESSPREPRTRYPWLGGCGPSLLAHYAMTKEAELDMTEDPFERLAGVTACICSAAKKVEQLSRVPAEAVAPEWKAHWLVACRIACLRSDRRAFMDSVVRVPIHAELFDARLLRVRSEAAHTDALQALVQ